MNLYDEAPSYTMLSVRYPVAKKEYLCCNCRLPIKIGEKYCRNVYLEDDNFCWTSSHNYLCYID